MFPSGKSHQALLLLVGMFLAILGPQTASAEVKQTETHTRVGKHKVCDPAPGLAGWLAPDRKELWSLTRVLNGQTEKRTVKAVVVSFFASWCTPCERGLPMIAKVAKANPDVAFVFVAVPPHDPPLQAFMKRLGITLDTIIDKHGSIRQQWLAKGGVGKKSSDMIPRTVVINDVQQIAEIFGREGADFPKRLQETLDTIDTSCRPSHDNKTDH